MIAMPSSCSRDRHAASTCSYMEEQDPGGDNCVTRIREASKSG